MTTDLERRIRTGLTELAEAPPVVPPPIGSVLARRPGRAPDPRPQPRRASAARLRPLLVAAVVAALLVLVPLLAPLPLPRVEPATGSVRLPSRFAPFSFLTGDLAESPVDRAMAIYAQRYGGGLLGPARTDSEDPDWQLVVLDASGSRYRRTHAIDPMSYRIAVYPGGGSYPNAMLLSPDGRHVAFGSATFVRPGLRLLDVATGAVRTIEPEPDMGIEPLAWSPDGSRLVVDFGWKSTTGYGVLDPASGTLTRLGNSTRGTAAFSPDGRELAVQGEAGITIVDRDGRTLREFSLPARASLAGQAAWSPDGARLAVVETTSGLGSSRLLTFVDARDGTPSGGRFSISFDLGMLGWRDPTTVVIWDTHQLATMSIHNGQQTKLAETGANVSYLQVAPGLIAGADVVDAGDVDRGPWPRWVRLTAAVLAGLGLVLAVSLVRLIRRRVRRR